ncbi:MAG: hypothetical protein KJI69_04250 [Patescibacteria group bacterium]|nr:hypothetical protein [Patescibacteria group bacterium]
MVSKVLILAGVIVVAFVLAGGMGLINFGGAPSGGVPQQVVTTVAGTAFSGELDVLLRHANSLDNSDQFQEGANSDIHTVFYKSLDGVQFSSIGEGALGTGGASRVTITPDMNSILYATINVAGMSQLYSDPEFTQATNSRITEFTFEDVTNNGVKEWLYKIGLRGISVPIAGQDASSLSIIDQTWVMAFPVTINSPANILNIGNQAGTVNFIRWELTTPQGTATAQTEYTIQIDKVGGQAGTEFWDVGLTTLEIPNIGIKSLTEFDEQLLSATETLYKFKVGDSADFANANYVITPQNANNVHPIPAKIVTSLSDNGQNDNLDVTLTIKWLDQRGGSLTPITDTVRLDES